MNVTMQIEKLNSGVRVHDSGHVYNVNDLDRIIAQLKVARRWLTQDRVARGAEKK